MEKRLFFLNPFALDPKMQIISFPVKSSWILSDLRRALKAEHFLFRERSPDEIKVFILSQYLDYPHTPDPSKLVTDSANPTYNDISLAEFSPVEKILKRFPTVMEDNEQIQMIVYVDSENGAGIAIINKLKELFIKLDKDPLPMKALEIPAPRPQTPGDAIQVDDSSSHGPSLRLKPPHPMAVYETGANEDLEASGDLLSEQTFFKSPFSPIKIFVRVDYIRIYHAVEYAIRFSPSYALPPAIVISGQPGIGKTMWMYYAIHRRIGLKLPFVWYMGDKFYRFTGTEFFIDKKQADFGADALEPLWCFVDSADAPNGLPISLSGSHFPGVIPIYITSPDESRWRLLHQTRRRQLLIMNPWSWEEMEAACEVYPHLDRAKVKQRFYTLGPTARICLAFEDSNALEFTSKRDKTISTMDIETLEKMIDHVQGLSTPKLPGTDVESHKLISLRRISLEPNVPPAVDFMTKNLFNDLLIALKISQDESILRIWKSITKYGEPGHPLLGTVFESYLHKRFRQKIQIIPKLMLKARTRYHASTLEYDGHPGLKTVQDSMLHKDYASPVDFIPTATYVFMADETFAAEQHIYYQPASGNQAGIDAFFIHEDHLYLLQYIVGTEHSVSGKLLQFLDTYVTSLPPKKNWCLLFLIPTFLTTFSTNGGPDASSYTFCTATISVDMP